MSEGPWIRFFPSDWLAGTRGMTAAETGIYITLIAMMYERGEPIPNETSRLARLCGTTTAALKSTLKVLVAEGKITLIDGGLWNDRVGVETEIRRDKSTSAQKSAETRWQKHKRNQRKMEANAVPSQSDRNANQIPESDKEDADASSTRARAALPEFDAWYRHYPHKVQRGAAEKAFAAARKLASLDDLISGVHRYIATNPPDRQWRNPATWLNGKGWLDAPAALPAVRSGAPPPFVPRNAGELARMKLNGTIDHEPASTDTGRLDPGDGGRQIEGPGGPRRFTVTADILGRA